ncbi:MAG: HAD-IB family hydrolase [Bacteroidota bacterium]|nr:MAG: HAD-IB family hydrolase [Bacteroidota bacterium]
MRYAFFDVDNTVLNFKSMFKFQDFFYANTSMYNNEERLLEKEKFDKEFREYFATNKPRLFINKRYYEYFKGRNKAEVEKLAEMWYNHEKQNLSNSEFWIQPVVNRLKSHQEMGDKVVLISGSCYEILLPLLRELNVADCISTQLEVIDGVYSGKIIGRQIIGDNKGESIKELAEKNKINLKECFAFGDHISDLSMHKIVGFPIVVEGDKELEEIARENSWEIISNSNQNS